MLPGLEDTAEPSSTPYLTFCTWHQSQGGVSILGHAPGTEGHRWVCVSPEIRHEEFIAPSDSNFRDALQCPTHSRLYGMYSCVCAKKGCWKEI